MPSRRHAVITGTGRAGTTFLVELLTHLGLDTGINADTVTGLKDETGRAGRKALGIWPDECAIGRYEQLIPGGSITCAWLP